MEEIKVGEYKVFDTAISTTNVFTNKIDSIQNTINNCKSRLNDESIFMGPACDTSVKGMNAVYSSLTSTINNFGTIATFLNDTSTAYKNSDSEASTKVLNTKDGVVNIGDKGNKGTPLSTCKIPDDIKQTGYTATCYEADGWHLSGSSVATPVGVGSGQKAVHDAWIADGARYKNGIAVMNVDGTDHYLVATASSLGKVGDNLTVNFDNGESIDCIVADAKSENDPNYTTYGHGYGDSVNILEFQVNTDNFNADGNPTTSTYNLDWDSSSNVDYVDNYGSIL